MSAGVGMMESEGPIVAVRLIRANPPAARERGAAHEAHSSEIDGTDALARPTDPLTSEGLDTAEGRSRMGDLYARAGLIPEAIFEYRRSVDLEPANAVRHFKLGLAYQSIRQFDAALASYQEAARLEPDSAWAHAAVSIVHAKMGHSDQAFDSYRTVKNLDDEMAEGLLEVILQYGNFHEV